MTDIDTDNSPIPERKRGSGVKMVYDLLRDEILDLVLPPGSPIDEVQLAERLKMSRTPIREALVRLAGEGLIDTLPNRSTMVANIDFLNLNPFFDALVLMYRVTTRLAAQNHRPEDLPIIRGFHEDYAAAVQSRDALTMIATNAAFHAAIAEAGRNPYFTSLFRRLLDEGGGSCVSITSPTRSSSRSASSTSTRKSSPRSQRATLRRRTVSARRMPSRSSSRCKSFLPATTSSILHCRSLCIFLVDK